LWYCYDTTIFKALHGKLFMELQILRKIGLSDGEIKIYSALLDSGSSPIRRIHEMTGIERRNIYDILNKLIEKGLVTYMNENRKRLFQVSHPSKITGYIEEKKQRLESTKKEIEDMMPRITEKFASRRPEISAEVFRGWEGTKAVWEDMLNYKEICWIGSGRYVPKDAPHFFESWNRRRIKLGVKWINLLRHEMRGEIKKPYELEEMRFLPEEFSGNPVVIAVFGDKTANFIFGDEIFASVVESRKLAENYRRYHRYLWDNVAKP
jgi:sugar-specific transcriptional regulator TrmB